MSIAVSLQDSVASFWNPGSDPKARAKTIKLLTNIFQKIIKNPSEEKYRKLNAAKLMPKLTVNGLGAVYILRHAGFLNTGTHFALSMDASLDPVTTALDALGAGLASHGEAAPSNVSDASAPPPELASGFTGKVKVQEVSREEAAAEIARLEAAEEEWTRKKKQKLAQAEAERAAAAAMVVQSPKKEGTDAEAQAKAAKAASKASAASAAAEQAAMLTEQPLDPEMQAIIAKIQQDKVMDTGKGKPGDVAPAKPDFSTMTPQQTKEWIEDAKKKNKQKKAEQARKNMIAREKSRQTTAKAAMALQERRNEYAVKAQIVAKKKQEKEKREARKRIKAKIALEKERRRKEQAQRELELNK